jgi:hypothetical protein
MVRLGVSILILGLSSSFVTAQLFQRSTSSKSPESKPLVSKSSSQINSSSNPSVFESVDPKFKNDVIAVAQKPLMSAKFTEDAFIANPTVYQWLLDHPDRTSLAWERLGIPCIPIRDLGKGIFQFKDDQGHEINWQQVGTLTDGRIWYATGKVKPGTLIPSVPVKAVAIVRHPQTAMTDGNISITPTIQVFFQTDSKAAATIMRIAGPAAPRMAEEGAEQLLFFFSGMSKYLQKNPDQVTALLSPPKSTSAKMKSN